MIHAEAYAHINKLVIWMDGQFLGNVSFDEASRTPVMEFTWKAPTFKISFEDFNGIVKAWNEMQNRRLDLGQAMWGVFQVDKASEVARASACNG